MPSRSPICVRYSMSRASVPPAKAPPGRRYARAPIRLSVLSPRSTSAASAPTRSAIPASSFVNVIDNAEGVHAVLHELRRLDLHPLDPFGERPEQLLDATAIVVRPNPDDDPVRVRDAGDRTPETQVLR